MKINDKRGKTEFLVWADLRYGSVYYSYNEQKYVVFTQQETMVCVESGKLYDEEEVRKDKFTKINATLEIQ